MLDIYYIYASTSSLNIPTRFDFISLCYRPLHYYLRLYAADHKEEILYLSFTNSVLRRPYYLIFTN